MGESNSTTKICSKCKECKPLTEYCKNTSKKIGICSSCKSCMAAYNRQRYLEKQEQIKARGRAWYAANRERMKVAKAVYCAANAAVVAEKKAAWVAANRDHVRAVRLAWKKANPERESRYYAENKDQIRERHAQWRASNRDRTLEYRNNRRARKNETGGQLSKGLAQKLFALQRCLCPCCREPLGDDYHMDHVIPLSLGGTNTDDNMQLLRATCNLRKHAKHPIDYMQSKGFLL